MSNAQVAELWKVGEFEDLVASLQRKVRNRIQQVMWNECETDRDEALNRTWYKLWTHYHTLESPDLVTTWIYRVATNEALMILRNRKLHAVAVSDEGLLRSMKDERTPERIALARQAITNYLGRERYLTAKERAVVRAVDLGSMSVSEYAVSVGITSAAAKTHLFRARQTLRRIK